ncbi:hypothetical protein OUZ56_000143 [Daphnia magna]|uniref:Uncharacterized protein n=1 Tax=Daphnia magna TaxID=35525 RepID=A0ABQ9ZZK2_9CRUS|nr:hypothetical protein OUZ56_000143 [Daphnia magna]
MPSSENSRLPFSFDSCWMLVFLTSIIGMNSVISDFLPLQPTLNTIPVLSTKFFPISLCSSSSFYHSFSEEDCFFM